MEAQAFHSRDAGRAFCEFKGSLVCTVSSRSTRTIYNKTLNWGKSGEKDGIKIPKEMMDHQVNEEEEAATKALRSLESQCPLSGHKSQTPPIQDNGKATEIRPKHTDSDHRKEEPAILPLPVNWIMMKTEGNSDDAQKTAEH